MIEPRFAARLVRLIVPRANHAETLGDLAERFASRKQRDGISAAQRWYWRQVGWFFLLSLREKTYTISRIRMGNTQMIRQLLQDVRYAFRTLRRSPVFTLAAVITLALGIGATTAVFTVVESVVLSPLPYPASDELVRVYSSFRDRPDTREFNTVPDFLDFREEVDAFESLASVYTYREVGVDYQTSTGPIRLRVLEISSGYFEVLGRPPILGREFRRDEEQGGSQLAIVSHAVWQDLLNADRDVVGKTINLQDVPFTIVGVAAAGFRDPIVGYADFWVPENLALQGSNNRSNYYLSILGRLKTNATIDQARAQLDVITTALPERDSRYPETQFAAVDPLLEDVVGNTQPVLYLLLGGAVLVLVIACVNVANLYLVRGLARHREFAVRAAIGSGRKRLVMQLIAEGMLVAFIGGIAGTAAAALGVRALIGISPDSLARAEEISFDPVVLLFALVVTGVTGVLFSLVPAWRSSDVNLGAALRESTRGTTGGIAGQRLRNVLVTGQVALAVVLLAGAGILARNIWEQRRVDLGFEAGNVLSFEVNLPAARYDAGERVQFHTQLAENLRNVAGIHTVGATSKLPASGGYHFWWYDWPTVDGEETGAGIQVRVIDGEYFDALDVDVIAGRIFDDRDREDAQHAAVINQSAATYAFGEADPLGRTIQVGGREWRIVGVVEDVAYEARGVFGRKVYVPHAQYGDNRNWALVYVVQSSLPITTFVTLARSELNSLDPQLVLYRPLALETMLAGERARERFAAILMLIFAGVALSLAATGLYGVLAYMVGQRTHEIGIRMALGAPARGMVVLILRHVGVLVGVGVVTGIVMSLAASRLLDTMVYGINPRDPLTLVLVTGVVVVVGFVAGSLPARRAARVAPGHVLR